VRHKASRYVRARKSLQRKGTRSATRRLVALSGQERRFIADTNHCIAKEVVSRSALIFVVGALAEGRGQKAEGKRVLVS
jgi:hypothetical protein